MACHLVRISDVSFPLLLFFFSWLALKAVNCFTVKNYFQYYGVLLLKTRVENCLQPKQNHISKLMPHWVSKDVPSLSPVIQGYKWTVNRAFKIVSDLLRLQIELQLYRKYRKSADRLNTSTQQSDKSKRQTSVGQPAKYFSESATRKEMCYIQGLASGCRPTPIFVCP